MIMRIYYSDLIEIPIGSYVKKWIAVGAKETCASASTLAFLTL